MVENSRRKIQRALISVYDKTGLVDFARALVDEFGIEIISTGGTASLLKESGIPVTLVERITGFPEMLDGRVKTLHPKIHAGILADRDNPEHMRQLKEQGIEPIDMVVVNLYPFEKTVADPKCTVKQAIEMIDIGGPCLLRAAAKNHKHVLVVARRADYARTLEFLRGGRRLAGGNGTGWSPSNAFQETATYDITIHEYFASRCGEDAFAPKKFLDLTADTRSGEHELRYGENPHQRGGIYSLTGADDPGSVTASGLEMDAVAPSFNNYTDAHAALDLCKSLSRELGDDRGSKENLCVPRVCTFIKHTNACGVGIAPDPIEAYRRAYLGDPNAAMGGILACSFLIDAAFAETVMGTYARWGKEAGAGGFFVEVWVAVSFHDDAVKLTRSAKAWGRRVRLLAVGDMNHPSDPYELEYKSISGGLLVQTRDTIGLKEEQWKVVTKREPTESEMSDLRLAWLVSKHTKSNAISICRGGMLIGNGAGQMSRVMSCRIATWLANDNGHKDKLPGSVAASDAFFPFSDGPNMLIDAGVTAIIQPGGSKRDGEVVAACDARDVAMIFTGTRHFKH